MPKMTFSVETDANGFFHKTKTFDPFVFRDITADLSVELKKPKKTSIIGSIDIDARDGSVQNQKRDFRIRRGEKLKLGEWLIDTRENVVVVQGKTDPARPNTIVAVEVTARL